MSCSKGSTKRSRPQKHQNRTSFRNDLHDSSKQTKFLNTMEVSGVCGRCKEIIEWKIKYKKYKPLTTPRKCIECEQKNIKHAYHILCLKCASNKKVCSKCNVLMTICEEQMKDQVSTEKVEFQTILKTLPERKRRTILRYLNKEDGIEKESKINSLLLQMDKVNIEDWSGDDLSELDCLEEEE